MVHLKHNARQILEMIEFGHVAVLRFGGLIPVVFRFSMAKGSPSGRAGLQFLAEVLQLPAVFLTAAEGPGFRHP